ncbi:MAG: hypothetical protein AB7O64_17610 [Methylibium sp.]
MALTRVFNSAEFMQPTEGDGEPLLSIHSMPSPRTTRALIRERRVARPAGPKAIL